MIDNRVCLHYVIDRLEDVLEICKNKDHQDSTKYVAQLNEAINKVAEFKRECTYNLGVNSHIKYKAGEQ